MKQKTIKRIKSILGIMFALILVVSELCSPVDASAKMVRKKDYEYTSAIHMNKNYKRILDVWGRENNAIKVTKLKTDSKNLIAEIRRGMTNKNGWVYHAQHIWIDIHAQRNGIYHVSYELWYKNMAGLKPEVKKAKINVTVYVDGYECIKNIFIGGKKLEDLDDWTSNRTYFSEKYKGKIKITPGSGYKILKIKNKGKEMMYPNLKNYYYSGGKAETIKNGSRITLNHIAKGTNEGILDDYTTIDEESGNDNVTENYDFITARTTLTIYYQDLKTKDKSCFDIHIYTMADQR